MSIAYSVDNERLLELFFSQSMDGFFFMMLDEPVEWGDHVDKDLVLDYVFDHLRMTKVNSAMLTQFGALHQEELLGATPSQFFAHDIATAKARWRMFYDSGHMHNETDERRLDGSPMRVEGDYILIYDDQGRIAGHFGIQRDVTDRHLANEELLASREQLRALASRLQKVREEERTEIAREIHDELGQALTALKLDISWMRHRLPRDKEIINQCTSILERIDQTIDAVRRIATELRPSVLDQLGLAAAAEWAGQEFATRTGIEVAAEISVDGAAISNDLGSTAFRILQEALTNVARHANASHVDIKLRQSPSLLMLEVADDGIGVPWDQLEDANSLGLIGMRERALACNGELTITCCRPANGTTVLLTVPLNVRGQS